MSRPGNRPIAKLSRPRLKGAVARDRLYGAIDRVRSVHAALGVVAPPGAGKTTLMASWLESRAVDGIWYQVDTGDADLATFFYYLGQAAIPYCRSRRKRLPLLTSEHLMHPQAFARRFFRQLFDLLPAHATLVLDNYQEIETGHPFHPVIATAIEEVPPGSLLVLISRGDLPGCYARAKANGQLICIEWSELKLNMAETGAVAAIRGVRDDSVIAQLHERTEGWVAGLVLALDGAAGSQGATPGHGFEEAAFDYFASQIFDQLSDELRSLLLATAVLPYVPISTAQHLSGNERAGSLLEDLHRRHLFIHRRRSREPVYWYHALFLSFLRNRAAQTYSTRELSVLHERAGQALESYGDAEAAIHSYVQAHAWDRAEHLVLVHAATIMSQARWQVLWDWIAALPTERVGANPWLRYWQGMARLNIAPAEARATLLESHDLALSKGMVVCQAQAAAAIIQSHILAYTAFQPMDAWITRVLEIMTRIDRYPSTTSEVQVKSTLLIAMCYRAPDHPALDLLADQVLLLLPTVEDPNLCLTAACHVLAWGSLTGPIEVGRRALPIVMSLLARSSGSALGSSFAWFLVAWYHCLTGDRERSFTAVARLEHIARHHDLAVARSFACVLGALLEQHAGNLQAAQAWWGQLALLVNPRVSHSRASSAGIQAWIALSRGDHQRGLELSLQSVEIFDEIGSLHHQVCYRLSVVWAHILIGNFDEARAWIADTRRIARPIRSNWQEILLRAGQAHMALTRGSEAEISACLEATFRLSRESGHDFALGLHIRSWMPGLCAAALQRDVEASYVRGLIARFGWRPPEDAGDKWPWPVLIRVTGRYEVIVDGRTPPYSRKLPRKTLTLLAALITFGATDVPEQRVVDALWPDDDGDAAIEALSTMIRRLRSLLGSKEAVLQRAGKISLNLDHCWVDAIAMEAMVASRNGAALDRAIDVYRGPFLAGEEVTQWMLPVRERLQDRFVGLVNSVADAYEAQHRYEDAHTLYRRGIEMAPLAETLYRGLMRSLARRGRVAEAVHVYRGLCGVLQAELGVQPSTEIQDLCRSMQMQPVERE